MTFFTHRSGLNSFGASILLHCCLILLLIIGTSLNSAQKCNLMPAAFVIDLSQLKGGESGTAVHASLTSGSSAAKERKDKSRISRIEPFPSRSTQPTAPDRPAAQPVSAEYSPAVAASYSVSSSPLAIEGHTASAVQETGGLGSVEAGSGPKTGPSHSQGKSITEGGDGAGKPGATFGYGEPPEYPRIARQSGWEGVVILSVNVTRDGRAESVRIRQSSGYRVLDEKAVEAIRKWRFFEERTRTIIPGVRDLKIRFSLDDAA
jgi:TonB family protein